MEVAVRAVRREEAIQGRITMRMTPTLERTARRSVRSPIDLKTMRTTMVTKTLKGPLALRMPGMQLKMMLKTVRR